MHFRINRLQRDGVKHRRYYKFLYTAALRLGVKLETSSDYVEFEFSGSETEEVKAHGENLAFFGSLFIEGKRYDNIFLIAKLNQTADRYLFVTFWPKSQHPDAHKSYTDPLVDTAMDDSPFDIDLVVDLMHPKFIENAGVSPATLMKNILEDITKIAVEMAADARQAAEEEKDARSKAEAEASEEKWKRIEAENKLRQSATLVEIVPPDGSDVDFMPAQILKKVSIGEKGKNNQKAIVLEMEDGTQRYNNWPRGFEERYNFAKRLEGRRVKTNVWGGYNGAVWFKNIYPAPQS